MNNVVCIIARTNSHRLSKKVLRDLSGRKMIEYIIDKMKRVNNVSHIYVCTSVDEEDKVLLDIAGDRGVKSHAGSRESVIDRMLEVAEMENADNVIRVTGDNPFVDEIYLDLMLEHHQANNVDYTRTEYLPLGVTAEVIAVDALKKCYSQMDPGESQYMMLYLFQPEVFNCQVLIPGKEHRHPEWSLTVDTSTDWEKALAIAEQQTETLNYAQILDIVSTNNIANMVHEGTQNVKFPANLMMTYKAYRQEMDIRIEKSRQIPLNDEYDNLLNAGSN